MSNISDDKLQHIIAAYLEKGKNAVLVEFSLSKETFNRYLREAKKRGISLNEKSKLISQILQNYSAKELEAIAHGGRIVPGYGKVPVISFSGQRIRVGAMTDTHIGSNKMSPDRIYQAFEIFKEEKVDLYSFWRCNRGYE